MSIPKKADYTRQNLRLLRYFISLALIVSMALPLAVPCIAANRLSLAKAPRDETIVYTLADLAAARLAVYTILDSRYRKPQVDTDQPITHSEAVRLLWHTFRQKDVSGTGKSNSRSVSNQAASKRTVQFADKRGAEAEETPAPVQMLLSDVLAEYLTAFLWTDENKLFQGIQIEDSRYTSRAEFVSMLLYAMGCQEKYDPNGTFPFAETLGLSPAGLSPDTDSLTLGDAALYIQCAMGITLRDKYGYKFQVHSRMNIPDSLEQELFPSTVAVFPTSLELDSEKL